MIKLNSDGAPAWVVIGILGLAAASASAQADSRAMGAAAAQRATAARVVRERPSGISSAEAKRLRNMHQDLKHMKRLAGADGETNRAEKARIDHKAQALRTAIKTAKSN
jgi:hypothetical protein